MKIAAVLALVSPVAGIDNGLGLKPPMGWRSWNLYGANVNQSLIQGIMDGMVSRKRLVDGVPTSLCDLGYCDVGLDDNWQTCHKGKRFKYNYHDDSGLPMVNTELFPDLIAMTGHAHKLGLTAGWYLNNCICLEDVSTDQMYQSDVTALVEFGFDAIKLDGCGKQLDLDRWADLINGTGKQIMIENCHWGFTVPNATWCPWNFFRTSGDIRASYGSMVGNLLTTVKWAQEGLSKPGCWSHPDGLQVGSEHGPSGTEGQGMNDYETRSHFAAWAIASAPLILSHDVLNNTLMDKLWPLIANPEIIAVNQAWAGHSGSPFKASSRIVKLKDYNQILWFKVVPHTIPVPSTQYFYKRLGGEKIAVLLMNHDDEEQELLLDFKDIPGVKCSNCHVRCLFGRKDLGSFDGQVSFKVASHDSKFLIIMPEQLVYMV
eukprot:TRINITY_DN44_c0_g1_i4.p1 TRINITY_DN44_c0_g1~~TRINITY_DN44_c0_g1_i4.p1  ORF type:complete len:448 (-),score=88.85 TRINITY_DN44_c0_g1_i4:253-1542(-)